MINKRLSLTLSFYKFDVIVACFVENLVFFVFLFLFFCFISIKTTTFD